MQKPDAFSESPHPIYQPMKPDARDYPPGSLEQPPAIGDQKQQMQYVTDGDIKKSISTPKGFSWTRLSKRAKILAVAILCVVIFVAAFVPAYITTHKNSTSAVATPPVNSTASNATSILLPKDNTTYRITIYGGRNGCNQFLSVGDCSLGNLVDMYSGDDDSGRQHWLFRLVENKTDIYTIQVGGGRAGCNTFLSGNACPSTASTLFGGDSLNGLQEWQAHIIPNTTNTYNFMLINGRSTCGQFLSTQDCTNNSNLVDVFTTDDGSGRQRWVLTAL